MSVESQALVWAHSQATGSALLALLAIADHDGDGGAWPSMETIAHRARVSRDAARKLIRKLEDMGEIRTDRNGGGGLRTANHMRTNRYEITLECPPSCDRSARHRERPEPVDNTPQPNGGDPSARRGAPQPNGGANHPINTPNGNSLDSSGESRASDRVSESENPHEHAPRKFGSIAAAQKIANAAKKRERYHAPARPEPVNDARRSANEQALTLPCPAGVGNGRHLVLVGTGTECARCGEDTFTIIDRHNQLEVTP